MAWKNNKKNIETSAKGNRSSTNHGLMENVYIFQTKGSKLNCNGYRIQTEAICR